MDRKYCLIDHFLYYVIVYINTCSVCMCLIESSPSSVSTITKRERRQGQSVILGGPFWVLQMRESLPSGTVAGPGSSVALHVHSFGIPPGVQKINLAWPNGPSSPAQVSGLIWRMSSSRMLIYSLMSTSGSSLILWKCFILVSILNPSDCCQHIVFTILGVVRSVPSIWAANGELQ